MGSKYTEAQKKATAEYMKDKHTFRVIVSNEKKNLIKEHADIYDGGSVNAFINRAIDEQMARDEKEELD